MRLPPGFASLQRPGHSRQDERGYVVEGEVGIGTDVGEQLLTAGMAGGKVLACVPVEWRHRTRRIAPHGRENQARDDHEWSDGPDTFAAR